MKAEFSFKNNTNLGNQKSDILVIYIEYRRVFVC